MEKEIKITPPEGYEIDKENSTFDCIKFKRIVKRWKDERFEEVKGFYIDCLSNIERSDIIYNNKHSYKLFATRKQAKSALAMARISQIMANDERFGGVVTDEEWNNGRIQKYCIIRVGNKPIVISFDGTYNFLAFHTFEQRDLFLKENEDLVKDYLMID